ncbi:YbaB/EbfC family nucleoid-associated protein [Actinokineospora auranticolor]|uniref:YbaB/EbfC DNA-binding family protein n=1 Tax=Actinokineospora auranticolor TaxID=155976 RepID=A0A2S6GDI4_9PSEU|nr:YbaB/EbfC family nucleoid-associated protein [Actinokineospora auranticolor]PPK63269.1 YbaB/EbfC DNA-binding family protein [Actinokineospora auranticolor]
MPEDIADSERMVEDWNRTIQERAVRYQAMAERVEELSLVEASADGAVRVTISARGILIDLQIAESAATKRMSDVSAQVMATVRRAQARIPDLLREVMEETIGTTDQTANKLLDDARAHFPEQVDEELPPQPPSRTLRLDVEDDEPAPRRPTQPYRHRRDDYDEDDFGGGSILS